MSSNAPHQSRLTVALHLLLTAQRVAALGTLDEDGLPFVSMVPYALDPVSASLVIHVSALASHTRNMANHATVSLLIMQPEVEGAPVHALQRVTLAGLTTVVEPQTPASDAARCAYLARFPEAMPMTQLGDFRFVQIFLRSARQVAGFGAARSLDAAELAGLFSR